MSMTTTSSLCHAQKQAHSIDSCLDFPASGRRHRGTRRRYRLRRLALVVSGEFDRKHNALGHTCRCKTEAICSPTTATRRGPERPSPTPVPPTSPEPSPEVLCTIARSGCGRPCRPSDTQWPDKIDGRTDRQTHARDRKACISHSKACAGRSQCCRGPLKLFRQGSSMRARVTSSRKGYANFPVPPSSDDSPKPTLMLSAPSRLHRAMPVEPPPRWSTLFTTTFRFTLEPLLMARGARTVNRVHRGTSSKLRRKRLHKPL